MNNASKQPDQTSQISKSLSQDIVQPAIHEHMSKNVSFPLTNGTSFLSVRKIPPELAAYNEKMKEENSQTKSQTNDETSAALDFLDQVLAEEDNSKVKSRISNLIANFENNVKVDATDSKDGDTRKMKSKVENAFTLLMSNDRGGSPTPKKRTSKKRLNHPTPHGTKSLMDFWKRKEKENN